MRILFLSRELPGTHAGGIGTYTATIAPAMAQRGHEVHVLSCAPEHASSSDALEEGVWWHRRPIGKTLAIGRRMGARQTAWRIATAIACHREMKGLGTTFDVVEAPDYMGEGLLVRGVPTVVNLHTPLHLLSRYNAIPIGPDRWTADALERLATRRAAIVTSPSRLLAETLASSGWLSSRPEIVRLPIDTSSWKRVAPVRCTKPNILVVGRLERRKAPEVAVAAAHILTDRLPDVTLTLVGRSAGRRGGTTYGRSLEELARTGPATIRLLGQLSPEGVLEEMSRARVVAVPSRFESVSIAALEAMAAARPVVCTDAVGAGELMVGTKAGAVVTQGDPHALADALDPYLRDPGASEAAGESGREAVDGQCAADVVAARREAVFAEVAS